MSDSSARPVAPDTRDEMLNEKIWRILIVSLSATVLLITIYCLSQGITTIFMHLYYFPVILLSYHYRRTGIILSALLGALYVALVTFYTYPAMQEIAGAVVRFFVFIGISLVVSWLSSRLIRQQFSLRTLFDRASGGILFVNRENLTITDINPYCIRLLGYERSELIGKALNTICTFSRGETLTPEIVASEVPDKSHEVRIKTKDGSEKAAILTVGEFPDNQYVLIITDISEQIQLKNEIEQLNVLQDNIITNANVWLMVLDENGRVLIWNRAAEEISGYLKEDVVGSMDIWKRLYPDSDYRHTITKKLNDIIQTDSYLQDFETTIITQTGELKVILWNTRKIPTKTDDNSTEYVTIGIDVTGRVRAERALRKSDMELQAVFNQSFQMIGLLNPDGTILKINRTGLDFGGVTEKEVVGKSFWETIWWRHSSGVREQVQKAIQNAAEGKKIRYETTCMGTGDVIRSIDFAVQPVKDETGTVVYLIPEGWDITQLKEAEAALTESENKFRGVAERSSDLIMLTDTEGVATYVSPSVKRILGFEPEDIVGKKPDEFLDDENLKIFWEFIWKILAGEDTQHVMISGGKTDGRRAIVEFSGIPIYEEGRITGLQLIGRDFTQQKADHEKIEELIRKQKEQLSIINQSPAVAFLWRAEEDWPVEMVSDNITQFGYTPENFLSGDVLFSAIVHPDDLAQVEEEVTYYSDHHIDTFKQIYRILGSDHRIYWIEDFTNIRRNKEGLITHYQGVIQNITGRKLAEEALEREKATVESILASLPGMFYMFYMFDSSGKFVRWNRNMETITGYSHDEIAQMGPLDFISEEFKKKISENIERALSEGSAAVESDIITKDGKIIPFYFSTAVQKIEGEPYIIGLALDITERKKGEEALRTVNNKLNLLSSITRHDIINQISAAEIFVELMEMDGEIPPDSKIAEDLNNVAGALKTIERQIVFTRDYQDLGVQSPNWQRVGRLIDETAPTISKGLRLINEVGTLEIYADPLFEKVIYNLFDNAIRYGEKITKIRFFSEETPDGLKLICEDDGVGVPADVKEKIFNRQYFKHTGLGLFLSQEILSITGMTIAETGVLGEGARFEISVPVGGYRM